MQISPLANLTKSFEAVVFDYSGLLVDDRSYTLYIVNETLKRFGKEVLTLQQFQEKFSLPFYQIFTDFGIQKEIAIKESLRIYHEKYPLYKQLIILFNDALSCLKDLTDSGLRLAIVSQTPRRQLDDKLQTLGIASPFASTIALGEVAAEKPDPLPLLETARRLGIRPDRTLFAGDMYEDIICARKAGAFSVAIDRPTGSYHTRSRLLEAMPDLVVTNLSELANILTLKQEVAA